MSSGEPITQLLQAWRDGDEAALHALMPLVHERLRSIAGRQVSQERTDHTLQPTALINEAFLSLLKADVAWNDRLHFYAVCSNIMRRILIDHARAARRQKRGGAQLHVTLGDFAATSGGSELLLSLDEAIDKLGRIDERKARILELHYFGGLAYEEIAQLLGISPPTVNRDLRFCKAWLRRELDDDQEQ